MTERHIRWTRRETLLAGVGGLSAVLLAACGSDKQDDQSNDSTAATDVTSSAGAAPSSAVASSSPASTAVEATASSAGDEAADGWSFTDDRGITVTLPKRPERVVAYIGTAAVLWDFGVRPVGVFGPQRASDGSPEPAAGNVDLDRVTSVGEDWDGVNLEALAELAPDLVVSGGADAPWVISEQLDQIAKIAPVAVVEVYQLSASGVIGNYARLAEALGVDLQSPELTEAKAAYAEAATRLGEAATAKPGLTVLATFADSEGLYIAKPEAFPDLREFSEQGVQLVVPTGGDEFWEALSWEHADTYPADLIIHDIRSFSLQPDVLASTMPTWGLLPAVAATQISGWSAETVLSYQGFATAMNDLAAAIDASADVV